MFNYILTDVILVFIEILIDFLVDFRVNPVCKIQYLMAHMEENVFH